MSGRLKPSEPWVWSPWWAAGDTRLLGLGLCWQSFKTRFFSPGNVKKLGETYPKISNAQNAELRLRWGQIVLKNDHREDFWKVREFLRSQVGAPDPLPPGHMAGRALRAPSLGQRAWQVPRAGRSAALRGDGPACASVQVSWRGPRGGPAQC